MSPRPVLRPRSATRSAERLRASPNFVLAFTMDGRPFVEKQTEPYVQYWLTERYRLLYTLFTGPRGATVDEAFAAFGALTGAAVDGAARRRLRRVIDDLREAGVLMGRREDTSRYDAQLVDAYLAHRPFPKALTEHIVRMGDVDATSRILDLAGGPGDLALQLAHVSRHVTLMELSRGFVGAARRRAAAAERPLEILHESANRLVHDDGVYDVVTIAQAMSWLDDLAVCRGLARTLATGGSVFVVQSAIAMDDAHPLAFVLGNRSILGHKQAVPFVDQCRALQTRLALIFAALDAPSVHRIDVREDAEAGARPRIVPAGLDLFRQRRPFDAGFARAFLTPQHVAATGRDPAAFWREVDERCTAADAPSLEGTHEWAVLRFRRDGCACNETPAPAREIAWDGAVPA